MSQIEVLPLAKLPLGETISLSYAWFFQKFADVLRISWLWLTLGAALFGLASWLQLTWMASSVANAQRGATHLEVAPASGFGWTMALAWLVMMFGTTSIAVAWHRRILLDEQPGLSGANLVSTALWRYIGIGIAIMLITFLPLLVIFVPAALVLGLNGHSAVPNQSNGLVFALIFLAIFALYVTALSFMLRLSLLLPARATGDLALTFRQAWHRTRGNTWRMFWGLLACSVPPLVALQIISAVVMAAVGAPKLAPTSEQIIVPALGLTVMSAVMFMISLLIVPIYIGFLSHCYRHFFQDGIAAEQA
jgi:hypothetical protein